MASRWHFSPFGIHILLFNCFFFSIPFRWELVFRWGVYEVRSLSSSFCNYLWTPCAMCYGRNFNALKWVDQWLCVFGVYECSKFAISSKCSLITQKQNTKDHTDEQSSSWVMMNLKNEKNREKKKKKNQKNEKQAFSHKSLDKFTKPTEKWLIWYCLKCLFVSVHRRFRY